MLRVSHLRKLVKPRSCPEIPINLLGTEIGQPVSNERAAVVQEGSVVADGSGYDFTDGLLIVDTEPGCAISPYTTFTISGKGPVPDLSVYSLPNHARYVVGVVSGRLYAAFRNPGSVVGIPWWAIQNAPVSVAPGVAYTLVLVVADTYVRAWLNGSSIGRQDIYPDYMGTLPWQLRVGDYYDHSEPTTYTGHIDSIRWEVGALYPDVDNI